MKSVEQKTVKFECVASLVDSDSLNSLKISEASLNEIKSVMGEEVSPSSSLMLFKAPLANGGLINKNGHGIEVKDLVAMYRKFANQPVNSEHNRNNTLGFIVKAYLSKHNEVDSIISEEEALASTAPLDCSIVFGLWPHVDVSLANILEEVTNPESPAYGLIRLSWECAFSSYNLLVGSDNVFESQIIEDESSIDQMEKFLRDNGGTGQTEDGKKVSMLLAGDDITPLGAGLVVSPAAYVGPITQITEEPKEEEKEEEVKADNTESEPEYRLAIDPSFSNEPDSTNEHPEDCECKECMKEEESKKEMKCSSEQWNSLFEIVEFWTKEKNRLKLLELAQLKVDKKEKDENFCSHLSNSSVETTKTMKIKSISDITDETLKEVTASEVTRLIADELESACNKHTEAMAAKEAELTEAKESADAALKGVDSIKAELEAVSAELKTLKDAQVAAKAEADFNTRMTSLNEEFELDDADREVIVAQIRDLDEETFASWKKSFDVLAKQKNKEFIKTTKKTEEKPEEEEKEVKETKASVEEVKVEEVIVDPIEQIKAKAFEVVPGSVKFSEDKLAAYKEAFSLKNVTIK
jgi:hypothetical protein